MTLRHGRRPAPPPRVTRPAPAREGLATKVPLVFGLLAVVAAGFGIQRFRQYTNVTPDSRVKIEAYGRHLGSIAKYVNRSNLWQAYLDARAPKGSSAPPTVQLKLLMERKRQEGRGGDYDPGKVVVSFESTDIASGSSLCRKDTVLTLPESVIVGFDKKEKSREEIQEYVFSQTEDQVAPYVERWVKISAVQAMGLDTAHAAKLIPVLEELLKDKWTTDDLRGAALESLARLRGGS